MDEGNLYVLIHSPLVGPGTWELVADQMRKNHVEAVVPRLVDSSDSGKPYWQQHAESVSQALIDIQKDRPLTLVAHSGAGPLLPVIRASLPNPVRAYVFVDAGLPGKDKTRLALMNSEDPEWARQFQDYLGNGGSFPNWSFDDLKDVLPNESVRRQLVNEIQPRALDFFTEPIPVPEDWPDADCVYILFSEPYQKAALEARSLGWPVYELAAGHFHMLVNPKALGDLILETTNK